MRQGFHTVLFDLDGTLSHSALLTMEAFAALAPRFGLPVPEEAAVRRATGYANPEFYDRVFPDAPRDIVSALGIEIEKEELRILPGLGEKLLFPGCKGMLERLRGDGVRVYLVSTGDPEHVYSVLRETGILPLFDQIACGRPDKEGMLRELTADREKSGYIMVGDMRKDSDGARANGILSAGACFGYCRRELAEFDMYLDAPAALLTLVAGGAGSEEGDGANAKN